MFFIVKQATVTEKLFKCVEFWGNKKLRHLNSSHYPFFSGRIVHMWNYMRSSNGCLKRDLTCPGKAGCKGGVWYLSPWYIWMWLLPGHLAWGPPGWLFWIERLPCPHPIFQVSVSILYEKPNMAPWSGSHLCLDLEASSMLLSAISHSEFCWNRNIIRERAKLTGVRFVSHSFAVSSVQSLSCVQLFVTPWIAVCQASLSITNSFAVPRFKLLLLCF